MEPLNLFQARVEAARLRLEMARIQHHLFELLKSTTVANNAEWLANHSLFGMVLLFRQLNRFEKWYVRRLQIRFIDLQNSLAALATKHPV